MDVVKFNIGDLVYLKLCPDTAGMVTGIMFRPHSISYYISWPSASETVHYEIELTRQKSFSEIAN